MIYVFLIQKYLCVWIYLFRFFKEYSYTFKYAHIWDQTLIGEFDN
jgi:hypothetical protein